MPAATVGDGVAAGVTHANAMPYVPSGVYGHYAPGVLDQQQHQQHHQQHHQQQQQQFYQPHPQQTQQQQQQQQQQFMPTMQYVQDGQMYSVVMDPTTGQMFQVAPAMPFAPAMGAGVMAPTTNTGAPPYMSQQQ